MNKIEHKYCRTHFHRKLKCIVLNLHWIVGCFGNKYIHIRKVYDGSANFEDFTKYLSVKSKKIHLNNLKRETNTASTAMKSLWTGQFP